MDQGTPSRLSIGRFQGMRKLAILSQFTATPLVAGGLDGYRRSAILLTTKDRGVADTIPTRDIDATLRDVLRDVLGLSDERVAKFDRTTELFGALPELDSMAVAGLLTEIEDRLGIVIDDDEVDGEMLENFGNLLDFAQSKKAA